MSIRNFFFLGEQKCVYLMQITRNQICINLDINIIIFIVSISFIPHINHTLYINIEQYVNNSFALLSGLCITYFYIYV